MAQLDELVQLSFRQRAVLLPIARQVPFYLLGHVRRLFRFPLAISHKGSTEAPTRKPIGHRATADPMPRSRCTECAQSYMQPP